MKKLNDFNIRGVDYTCSSMLTHARQIELQRHFHFFKNFIVLFFKIFEGPMPFFRSPIKGFLWNVCTCMGIFSTRASCMMCARASCICQKWLRASSMAMIHVHRA